MQIYRDVPYIWDKTFTRFAQFVNLAVATTGLIHLSPTADLPIQLDTQVPHARPSVRGDTHSEFAPFGCVPQGRRGR